MNIFHESHFLDSHTFNYRIYEKNYWLLVDYLHYKKINFTVSVQQNFPFGHYYELSTSKNIDSVLKVLDNIYIKNLLIEKKQQKNQKYFEN